MADDGAVMNLPVLRCQRQTRREAGAQSQQDSLRGAGWASTGVDRHHVAEMRRGSGANEMTIGGH